MQHEQIWRVVPDDNNGVWVNHPPLPEPYCHGTVCGLAAGTLVVGQYVCSDWPMCASCLQDGMLQLLSAFMLGHAVGPVLLLLANNWQAWWSYIRT